MSGYELGKLKTIKPVAMTRRQGRYDSALGRFSAVHFDCGFDIFRNQSV
jgi:hypothetical protein